MTTRTGKSKPLHMKSIATTTPSFSSSPCHAIFQIKPRAFAANDVETDLGVVVVVQHSVRSDCSMIRTTSDVLAIEKYNVITVAIRGPWSGDLLTLEVSIRELGVALVPDLTIRIILGAAAEKD